MSTCDKFCVQLALYIDGELDDQERKALERHLKDCLACRNRFHRARRFLGHLQRAAPLYVAPDELRSEIESIFDDATPGPKSGPGYGPPRLPQTQFGNDAFVSKKRSSITAILAGFLLVAGLWAVTQIINPTQSLTFASIAVDAHQRYSQGRLPLELSSDSPAEISNWFDGKVQFSLKLPNYQEVSGQGKLYSLKGARLIGFKNDYVAYVAYQMGQHPISLVVASSNDTRPHGGEQITSRGLVFHYETIAGLKVITWEHRGLTYALVSDLDERGQQSCLVCHQGAKSEKIVGGLFLRD